MLSATRSVALNNLVTGSHVEQAKRLYGLDEMEAEALEVWRLIVPQTARGQNLNAALLNAKLGEPGIKALLALAVSSTI
jgi:hypothetical protein